MCAGGTEPSPPLLSRLCRVIVRARLGAPSQLVLRPVATAWPHCSVARQVSHANLPHCSRFERLR